ncbi:hypothetical protein [Phaffia rhodozyma]|uniref:Uncharacterized protein n=1 Tax=Phaffia rhodozyma TaxID=264483 RepID=A0A0F7SK73_PHARH|nr:hypothetical protein [Phaffia rhodozyma]
MRLLPCVFPLPYCSFWIWFWFSIGFVVLYCAVFVFDPVNRQRSLRFASWNLASCILHLGIMESRNLTRMYEIFLIEEEHRQLQDISIAFGSFFLIF